VRDNTPPPPPPDLGGGMCVMSNQSCVQGVDICCDPLYYCDDPSGGTMYKCVTSPVP
jgi:hypothetical protein